MHALRAGAWRV